MTAEAAPRSDQQFDPTMGAEFAEATQGSTVSVLTEYDPTIAAGMGLLLPIVAEKFGNAPVPQEKLERIINSPDRAQFVARGADGEVVGISSINMILRSDGKPDSWVEDVAVDPSARGKNAEGQSVATQMEHAWESWCIERGIPACSLKTEDNEKRAAARRFYEREGFVVKPGVQHTRYTLPAERPEFAPTSLVTTFGPSTVGEDHVRITVSDPVSGVIAGAVNMNVLLGAGKEPEGFFDTMAKNPDFDAADTHNAMWSAIDKWSRENNVGRVGFATDDSSQTEFAQTIGAETNPTQIEYTNVLIPQAPAA